MNKKIEPTVMKRSATPDNTREVDSSPVAPGVMVPVIVVDDCVGVPDPDCCDADGVVVVFVASKVDVGVGVFEPEVVGLGVMVSF